MPAICLYFQVHQPYRLRRYTIFDLGQNSIYEDDDRNCDAALHASRLCYLPMNDLLLRLIQRHGKRFRVAFSISGVTLDQFEQYAPEVLESFQALAATGCVEFLAETYSHSLAFLYAPEEFTRQVALHSARIEELFKQKPRVFRHTELVYNNDIAKAVEDMGFAAMLAEGADHVLGWRSPNFIYQPVNCLKLKLLLKNYQLSDDVSLRFSHQNWDQWPLTADKFASWCHAINGVGETINLFMDYETFGLRHKADTGIFDFMEALPTALLAHNDFYFRTPGEVATAYSPMGRIDVPQFMSWATSGRDLDTWLGNDMQKDAIHSLYALTAKRPELYSDELKRVWLHLQTADHFAYMCTKWFSEAAESRFDNPYGSPYDAYINYMNVLADYELALDAAAVAPQGTAPTAGKTASRAGGAAKAGTKASTKADAKASSKASSKADSKADAKAAKPKATAAATKTGVNKTATSKAKSTAASKSSVTTEGARKKSTPKNGATSS